MNVMRSETSKKASAITEEELKHLELISGDDVAVAKLLQFYKTNSVDGVARFLASMNRHLNFLSEKIDDLENIPLVEMDKFELYLRTAKDGMMMMKSMTDSKDKKVGLKAKNATSPPAGDKKNATDSEEEYDPENPEHNRSVLDKDADQRNDKQMNR